MESVAVLVAVALVVLFNISGVAKTLLILYPCQIRMQTKPDIFSVSLLEIGLENVTCKLYPYP